jgi:hypothetical protein
MLSAPFPSELFILIGLNVFIALSLLTSLFDKPFPTVIPYVYQIAALAGFGAFWASLTFLSSVEARFWCSLSYLTIAVANVLATNVYVAISRKSLGATGAFLGAVTIPTVFLSFLSVSCYVNGIVMPMPPLPIIPVESVYVVLAVCAAILGFSMVAALEPKLLRKMFWTNRKRQAIPDSLEFAVDTAMDNEVSTEKEAKRGENR